MAGPYQGIEDFVAALTGAPAIEGAAYNSALDRLTKERSRMANLDRDLARAREANMVANALARLEGGDMSDSSIIVGKRGSDFSGLQTGREQERQNVAGNAALEAVLGMIEEGELGGMDAVNALTGQASNKTLTANNFNTVERADLAEELAAARANLEQIKLRGATEKLPVEVELLEARRDREQLRSATGGAKAVPLPSATLLAQYFPFVDGKQPGLQEFLTWRAEQAEKDDKYVDFDFAFRRWKLGIPAGGAAPATEAANAIAGAGNEVGPVRVVSDADYAALPSGSVFIAPDGTTRRKP